MSLVAHWRLEGDATDAVGNHDGYGQGGPSYASAKLGDGYDNTANNSTGVELIRHDDFTEYEDYYSFSLWFKSTTTSGSGDERVISRDASEYPTVIVEQNNASPQTLNFPRGTGNNSTTVSVNQWHHLAFSIDGGQNNSKLYIDGELVATGDVDSSTQSKPYVIGGNTETDNDISGNHFEGKIDDVRLYDHVLSEKEVKQLSQAKVLHYKMNDSEAVTDASGQGNDGDLNGPTFSEDTVIGSGSYSFDGSNDYIQTPVSGDVAKDSYTISAWFKLHSLNSDEVIVGNYGGGDGILARLEQGDDYDLYQDSGSIEGGNVTLGEWTHVAYVYDGSNSDAKIYENGIEIASGSIPFNSVSKDLRVADDYDNRKFDGQIADVQIYTKDLSESEIQSLYEQRASIDDQGGVHAHELMDTSSGPAPENLDAWWPLDGHTRDYAGNNDAEARGATATSSTELGQKVYSFDGSDMIPTRHSYNTTNLTATTVSAWYKSSSSADQIIASSDRSEYWRLGVGSGTVDGIQWTVDSSDMVSSASRTSIQDGNWHHIVGVFDTSFSNDHKIYIDGQLDSETSYHGSGIGSGNQSYTHIGIGSEASSFDGATAPDDWMNGELANVRVYDRGLTASEVSSIYDNPSPLDGGQSITTKGEVEGRFTEVGPAPQSLVGWWPLDGHTRDLSENGNDGTNNGASKASGLGQGAYLFDGASSNIDTAVVDGNSVDIDEPFTVSFWVNIQGDSNNNSSWIVGNYDSADGGAGIVYNRNETDGISVYDGTNGQTFQSHTIEQNAWHHITLTGANDSFQLFVDGVDTGTATTSRPIFTDTTYAFRLGKGYINTGYALNGKLQDVRIYDRALTQAEVKQLKHMTDPRDKQRVKQTTDGTVLAKEEFTENL